MKNDDDVTTVHCTSTTSFNLKHRTIIIIAINIVF